MVSRQSRRPTRRPFAALERAGVEFANGDKPGVKLKAKGDFQASGRKLP